MHNGSRFLIPRIVYASVWARRASCFSTSYSCTVSLVIIAYETASAKGHGIYLQSGPK